MEEKKCSKCGEVKSISNFCKNKNRKDGYNLWCKDCSKISAKIYRENNKDKTKQYQKDYYSKEINKKRIRNYNRSYKIKNREKINKSRRDKLTNDTYSKMIHNIRNRILKSVKYFNLSKQTKTINLIGCDKETLMNHLQSTGIIYDPNFDIYNYDSSLYHIDHIKTFADVKKGLYTLEEVCHYTNLQILPAEVNLSKSGTSW